MKMITLNKAFDYTPAENKGVFYYLSQLEGVTLPWSEMDIDSQLDIYYHMNHSGKKLTSPLIDGYLSNDELTENDKAGLAAIIYSLFGKTWDRLWYVYNSEYNPINNYDLTEEYSGEDSLEHGKSTTRTDNLTSETTNNLTETETPNKTITRDKSVYGFNSSNPSPSETEEDTETGESTIDNTGTQTIENTGTQTLEDSGTDVTEKSHTLTRFGNIGVTTTQQMLSSEISLWVWNYFLNVIIPNIDGVLTISLY